MWTSLVLACGLVAGCFGPDGPDRPNEGEREEVREAFRKEMDLKSKARNRLARPKKHKIDWDVAERRGAIDTSVMTEEARQAIAKSAVPVLLPRKEELLKTAIVLVGDGWYTATMNNEQYSVFVRGTQVERPMAWTGREKKALRAKRPDGLRISRVDGIVSAHFTAAGSAYNIEVECKQGSKDPLCADDGEVGKLYQAFGLAGGKRGAKQ